MKTMELFEKIKKDFQERLKDLASVAIYEATENTDFIIIYNIADERIYCTKQPQNFVIFDDIEICRFTGDEVSNWVIDECATLPDWGLVYIALENKWDDELVKGRITTYENTH